MRFVRIPQFLKKLFPSLTWDYNTGEKVVYITFDDGPIPESTAWTLELLRSKNVKATFFCVGDNVRKYPGIYHRILNEGHAVGNHTHNHLRGFTNQTQCYVDNVNLASQYIDSKLFRPPYGMIKRSQAKKLLKDYKIIMWDVLSEDYRQDITPEECYKAVLRSIRPGSIILFHNHLKSEKNMRYALPRLIDELKKQGYQFGVCE
ncbi:polysaccharide deacetylase family protein [Ancylomarina sp. YFZ004]